MARRVVVGTWPTTAYRLSRILEACPPGAEVAVAWGEAPADRLTAVRDHDVASRLARRLAAILPIGTAVAVSWRLPGCRGPASARPAAPTRRAPRREPTTPARRRLRDYGVRALRAVNPDPPMKGVPADG
jgi:hypothetical protein